MWNLPGPVIKPLSLPLASEFLTTGPGEKYSPLYYQTFFSVVDFLPEYNHTSIPSILKKKISDHYFSLYSLFFLFFPLELSSFRELIKSAV